MNLLVHLLRSRFGLVGAALVAVAISLAAKSLWRENVLEPTFGGEPDHLVQQRGAEARHLARTLAAQQEAARSRFGTYISDTGRLLAAAAVHRQMAANHPVSLSTGPTFYEIVVQVTPTHGQFRLRSEAGQVVYTCSAPDDAGCRDGRWAL